MVETVSIKVGQRWVIPVLHLDGREVVHCVTEVGATFIRVEPEEDVNGYCSVPRRRFETFDQAPNA